MSEVNHYAPPQAQTRVELEGFGGWLAVFGFRLGFSILGSFTQAVGSEDTAERLYFVVTLIVMLGLSSMFARRNRNFVKAYIGVNTAYLILVGIGTAGLMADGDAASSLGFFVGMCLGEFLWFAYLLKSRRVANTFTE